MASSSHPLDLEIADLVDGFLESEDAARIEAHLTQCLLCRIKRQRLIGQSPISPTAVSNVVVPDFPQIQTEEVPVEAAAAGELWTTRGAQSLLVLVRAIDELEAIVVPVVIDVEVADDECRIIPEDRSPIRLAVAVYDSLRVNIPVSALDRRVVPMRDVSVLQELEVEGVSTGLPIEGPADPRLEVRQFLVDCLTALTPHEPESGSDQGSSQVLLSERVQRLADALAAYRPAACAETFTRLRIADAAERGWTGIARVDELGVVVLAIDVPTELRSRSDFLAAHKLLTRCNGTALAIVVSSANLSDVFEAPGLFGATYLPAGAFEYLPTIKGVPLEDAIAKYLGSKVTIPLGSSSVSRGSHVRVENVLAEQVVAAVEATAATSLRIEAKKKGYQSLATSADALLEILHGVLVGDFDPDEVADIPWDPEP